MIKCKIMIEENEACIKCCNECEDVCERKCVIAKRSWVGDCKHQVKEGKVVKLSDLIK